ncbi:unnamed protein product [Moneuplotes crassus]|uniref:AP2/ERF domain-containing protein n=1 Tax=Euplotes crassus TaxID=5936 RepID=A0AAD1UC30_EUPCR|nr:unnamed protein product [Moneuplotes crassus]
MLSNYSINSANAQALSIAYYEILEAALSEVFNQFCWDCDLSQQPKNNLVLPEALKSRKTTVGDLSMLCESQNGSPVKQTSLKAKKNKLPDVKSNLTMILQMINANCEVSFIATTKSSRGLHNGASKRRSQYIGVLGNGSRWQVLINISGKKKYIGTFGDEKEAAIMHDFYSIGLNKLDAKTNFSYEGMTVQDMIMNYLTNDGCFNPSEFLTRV